MAHSESTIGSNKRPRTSESDVGFGIDLNDNFDNIEGEGPPSSTIVKGQRETDDILIRKSEHRRSTFRKNKQKCTFLKKKNQKTKKVCRKKIALTDLQIVNKKPQPHLDPENQGTFLKNSTTSPRNIWQLGSKVFNIYVLISMFF